MLAVGIVLPPEKVICTKASWLVRRLVRNTCAFDMCVSKVILYVTHNPKAFTVKHEVPFHTPATLNTSCLWHE